MIGRTWFILAAVLLLTVASPNHAATRQAIVVGDLVAEFGLSDGPEDQIIGLISDVEVLPNGEIVVVDELYQRIGWIVPSTGEWIWFGREGDGPREFRYLRHGVAADEIGIVVLDPGHRRLLSLRRDGGEIDVVGERTIVFDANDICVTNGRIFGLGLYEGRIIHEIAMDGSRVASFGEPITAGPYASVRSDRWQREVQKYSVRGRLVCGAGNRSIVVVPKIIATVRAFGPDGQKRWSHELTPYFQTTMVELPNGIFQVGPDPRTGWTTSVTSIWVSESQVGVQIVDKGRGNVELHRELRLIDLGSGSVLERVPGLPQIAGWFGQTVVVWENLPFPQVRIHESTRNQ